MALTRIKVSVEVDAERKGVFDVFPSVSYKRLLDEDQVRRGVLGADAANASPGAQRVAEMYAYLAVRVDPKTAPLWWQEVDFGLSQDEEDEVLERVYEAVVKDINAHRAARSKDADEKAKDLRKDLAEADGRK